MANGFREEDFPVEPNAVEELRVALNALATNVLTLEQTVTGMKQQLALLRRDLDTCIRETRDASSTAHRAVTMVRRGGW